MKIPQKSIVFFNQLLSGKPEVLITTHYNPDGDAIGSSLALYHFLLKQGINAKVLIPNELPTFLQWMPGADKVILYSGNEDSCNKLIASAELIFCIDYNGLSRVKLFTDQLRAAQAPRILIDHHIQPENDFDLVFSTTNVSSTSELLFNILAESGFLSDVSKDMAECLFVGMMTDTGSFSYACNQPETFEIAANLIKTGFDVEKIHRMVYDTYSESRMRLLGFCLANRLKVIPEFATAYIWLTRDDLNQFNYQQGDTEGVVNYALSIQNVAMAALFTERDDRIRVSLRSKGVFSVNDFSGKHLDGGGHRNAAGGDIFKPMYESLAYFESLLPQYQFELQKSLVGYK